MISNDTITAPPANPLTSPPPVVTLTQPQSNAPHRFSSVFKWLLILVSIILILILGYELYNGIKPLLAAKTNSNLSNNNSNINSDPKLYLTVDKTNIKVGENISIKVILDSGTYKAQSFDAIIKFDPQILTAPNLIAKTSPTFSLYPISNIDQEKGIAAISGTMGVGKPGFKGQSEIASFMLQALKKGTTQINVEYSPGSTTKSNIIDQETARNVLKATKSLEININ